MKLTLRRSKPRAQSPPDPEAAPDNPAAGSAQPHEVLAVSQISQAWVFAAVAMVLGGGVFNSRPLFGLGVVLSVALAVAWGWARWALSNLSIERHFDQTRAFWGEVVNMSQVFVNNKPLPVPWLAVDDYYPPDLTLLSRSADFHPRSRSVEFSTTLSLGWYERVARNYRVECRGRGDHEFGPIEVMSGDIFGLFRLSIAVRTPQTLLVYPRYVPVERLGIPARQPFGDNRSTLPIATDPLRLRSVREYAYGDSPRHIHWKATARRGVPQTRLFEPAATPQLYIFCNQETFEHMWEGLDSLTLELTITVAASIANYGLENGYMVGLQVNAFATASDRQVKVPPSRDPGQFTRILESLARIDGWSGLPMDELLRSQRAVLPRGATIVLVTGLVTDDMLEILLALRRAGHPVTVVEAVASERAAERAARSNAGAYRAQGITYYLVENLDEAQPIEELTF